MGSHLLVAGHESFEVSTVNIEVVVDALEIEQFSDDHCVEGHAVSVELGRTR